MNVQEELHREKIDPYLTADRLGTLLSEALGESVEADGTRVLTGGCWNRVIGVRYRRKAGGGATDEVVCKISPKLPEERLVREHAVLSVFERETSMPVPMPYGVDTSGSLVPGTVLVMSRVPGVVLHECMYALDGAGRAAVSEQIARHVTELHRKRSTGFGGVELAPSERHAEWADFWLPRFDAVIEEVVEADVVSESMVGRAREVRSRFRPALDIGAESTCTHYDIWSGNVMVDPEARPARVTGYIDIPGFYADYAREISFMAMFGMVDRTFLERYGAEHELDPGFELRLNIYNLKMHLKHITMYPHESYYREGARSCLEHIEEHLR